MSNCSKRFQVVSAIFMVLFSVVPAMADDEVMKQTNMTVFFQDYSADFGTFVMTDDLVTEGPELTSAVVGRGQGISITTGLDGINAYVSFSLVFTNDAYNGSTLQVQGNGNRFLAVREYSVVSGTGKFRYARGYLTFETHFSDPSTFYTLFRVNVTIRHY
ncbi:Peptidase M20/M25/M40 family protein [Hibiscus syriacus]|uniref:Dirigent protein n=1 Tax=Hibiscus syriacus TaxID=106335 RepID=A0A6A2ZXW2_HIBSY|nr:Peptidase M20/M25/M40 family protein [Hibiscus syriacus]